LEKKKEKRRKPKQLGNKGNVGSSEGYVELRTTLGCVRSRKDNGEGAVFLVRFVTGYGDVGYEMGKVGDDNPSGSAKSGEGDGGG